MIAIKKYLGLIRVKDELFLINILSLILLLLIIFYPSSVLRSFIGIPFVLFFPGYTILALLFPNKNDINSLERFALSLALSIAIVSFLGLLLSISPIGLKPFPAAISLYFLIFIISVIKWVLKSKIFIKRLNTKQDKEFKLKLNFILIFVLLIILSTLIRFFPTYGYTSAPIQYEGEIVFNYNYLLNYGHFPQGLPIYGIYNQDINRAGDPLIIIVFPHVYLQLITNLPNADYFALIQPVPHFRAIIFSLCLSTILSLTILSISQRYVRSNEELSLLEKIIVMSFSLLGSPTIILALTGQNTGYGFVFFMVIMSLLLKEKVDNRHMILLLFFTFYLMVVYHTIALIFAVLMIIALFYTFLFKQKFISHNYILLYLLIYSAYLIYIYTSFFGMIVNQLNKFIHLLLMIETKPYLSLEEVSFPSDINFLIIYGIAVISSIIPLFLAFICSLPLIPSYICKLKDKEKDIIRVIFITLLLISIGFYNYMGIVGLLHRGKEYASYFSVLAFSILLNNVTKKLKKILILCVIVAILTSIYVYFNSGVHNYHLIASEKRGNEWVLKYIPQDNVVFTDYRLSALLVANGYFKVVGLLDPPRVSTKVLKERLHNIFYGNDPTKAIESLKNITTTTGENPDYLLFSIRMARGYPEPSIYVVESNVKPAPEDFLSKFDNSYQVNKIYNNQIIHIYTIIK